MPTAQIDVQPKIPRSLLNLDKGSLYMSGRSWVDLKKLVSLASRMTDHFPQGRVEKGPQ